MTKKKELKPIATVVRFEKEFEIQNYEALKAIGKESYRSANAMLNIAISEYVNKKVKP